jgi:TonB family protein
MSLTLLWNNAIAYSLQVGVLVAAAAFVPAVLGLRLPRARLAYWHILLAACLLLPLVRPWRQEVVTANIQTTTTILAVAQPASPERAPLPMAQIALLALAAGAAARLLWLAAGFWKLYRYRRDSRLLDAELPWQSEAEIRISEAISSPVTFGLRRPVVLVPPQFTALDAQARRAILCHELLHVARRDWLFTVAEELVRAVLWFHPAIWWLLGEIQLCREQAVDREVVARTSAKDEYVDALLAVAGRRAAPGPDLLPAPLFLRKRHLKQRVVSIFEEVRMSKSRLITALAAGLCILVATCWFVTATFPLSAAPQTVTDADGVTVDTGGAALLHRPGVGYPEGARHNGVQGVVTVEVKLDGSGNVTDARVLSGPDELRKPTLASVLQWHFGHDSAGSTRQITVSFSLPPAGETRTITFPGGIRTVTPNTSAGQNTPNVDNRQKELGQLVRVPLQGPNSLEGRTIRTVVVSGLQPAQREELLSKLPVHVGDTFSKSLMQDVMKAAREYDEHLNVFGSPAGDNEAVVQIVAPNTAAAAAEGPMPPNMIRVGGNVQSTKLVQQTRPLYPPDAKQQRIQGVVRLQAVIAKDGTVKSLEVVSGDPLLAQSALEAVLQWVYQPTLLNGQPVEVQTMIDVNYTLSQ